MPRPIRWLLLSIGTLFFLAVASIVAMNGWSHLHEGTYYYRTLIPPRDSGEVASLPRQLCIDDRSSTPMKGVNGKS